MVWCVVRGRQLHHKTNDEVGTIIHDNVGRGRMSDGLLGRDIRGLCLLTTRKGEVFAII